MKRAPSRIMSISDSNPLVQPYLFFGGRCEEALNFCRNAVGAELQMLTRFKEGPGPHGLPDCFDDKTMHCMSSSNERGNSLSILYLKSAGGRPSAGVARCVVRTRTPPHGERGQSTAAEL